MAVKRPVLTVFKQKENSPPNSLNSSISVEHAINGDIRTAPMFSGFSQNCRKDRHLSANTRQKTARLGEENSELKLELNQAKHEIGRLNLEIMRLKQEHKLHLVEITSEFERKMHQMQVEMDRLVKENKHKIRKMQDEYEDRIEGLQVEGELELNSQLDALEKQHQSDINTLQHRYYPEVENLDVSRFRRRPALDPSKDMDRDTIEADQTANWPLMQVKSVVEECDLSGSLETELKQLIQRIE